VLLPKDARVALHATAQRHGGLDALVDGDGDDLGGLLVRSRSG
jgi:hypothetical protein